MRLTHCLRISLTGLAIAIPAIVPSAALAEIAVGAARVVVADVSAETALASRKLAVSDDVRYRELIATARDSATVIQFVDQTELAIGEQARVRLDDFVFDPGTAGKLDLTLEFGALRFSTGTMAKSAYRIATPTASLAVRGTEFDLAVDDDGATYLLVRHGAVTITARNGASKQVGVGQFVTVDVAGVPTEPRIAAAAPAGALPAKIDAMDTALAGAVASAGDAADLGDLSVLAKARALRSGTRPEAGKSGKLGKADKDKKSGGPGPL
ncbi:MAG: FecR family protein [Dongiaceae bacterium]